MPRFYLCVYLRCLLEIFNETHEFRGVLAQNLKSVRGDCKGARGAKIQNGQQGKYGPVGPRPTGPCSEGTQCSAFAKAAGGSGGPGAQPRKIFVFGTSTQS